MKKLRGHKIEKKGIDWVYSDDRSSVKENWMKKGCGSCNLKDTPEGHDACLGTLDVKIVMNACCGHGEETKAYVQFWNGETLSGKEAIELQKEL